MTGYKAGDEATVYWTGQPAPGVIEKVGRSLVYIRSHGRVEVFRISDQRSTGQQVGTGTWFATPAQEQAALEERDRKAHVILGSHGILLASGCDLTLEQVEALAEVVKDWED